MSRRLAGLGRRAHSPGELHNAPAHHNLGSVLYKLGRYDESAVGYRESLRLRPSSPATYLHLGHALREAGKLDEAKAAWQQALHLAPGDAAATAALNQVF